jgi:hypothetical protein
MAKFHKGVRKSDNSIVRAHPRYWWSNCRLQIALRRESSRSFVAGGVCPTGGYPNHLWRV